MAKLGDLEKLQLDETMLAPRKLLLGGQIQDKKDLGALQTSIIALSGETPPLEKGQPDHREFFRRLGMELQDIGLRRKHLPAMSGILTHTAKALELAQQESPEAKQAAQQELAFAAEMQHVLMAEI